MSNQAHRKKKITGRICLPPQPNDALQNYPILRPGYRSVRFVDTKCTVGIFRTHCHSICAKKMVNAEFYASIKPTIMAMC